MLRTVIDYIYLIISCEFYMVVSNIFYNNNIIIPLVNLADWQMSGLCTKFISAKYSAFC